VLTLCFEWVAECLGAWGAVFSLWMSKFKRNCSCCNFASKVTCYGGHFGYGHTMTEFIPIIIPCRAMLLFITKRILELRDLISLGA